MNENSAKQEKDLATREAQRRVEKIRKFYKNISSWVSTGFILIAIDFFMNHSITWSKFPVFFFAIALVFQFIGIMRLQYFDKTWEEKMVNKHIERFNLPDPQKPTTEDYSEELLRGKDQPEMEKTDLSSFRKLKKPWKDDDLV
jgi:2TM domain